MELIFCIRQIVEKYREKKYGIWLLMIQRRHMKALLEKF